MVDEFINKNIDNKSSLAQTKNLNILLNLNENSYKPEDVYLKLFNQLKDLIENENITIDKYFETISNNYSNWGESFYISNISIKGDEPYLLFRPKVRPKLLEFFQIILR